MDVGTYGSVDGCKDESGSAVPDPMPCGCKNVTLRSVMREIRTVNGSRTSYASRLTLHASRIPDIHTPRRTNANTAH